MVNTVSRFTESREPETKEGKEQVFEGKVSKESLQKIRPWRVFKGPFLYAFSSLLSLFQSHGQEKSQVLG